MRTKVLTITKNDIRVDTFRVGGAGGQRRDKVSTGVRITHLESGATGQATESRMQGQNKKLAFRRMAESPKFQTWVRIKAAGDLAIDLAVDESMKDENIKVEVREADKWVATPTNM